MCTLYVSGQDSSYLHLVTFAKLLVRVAGADRAVLCCTVLLVVARDVRPYHLHLDCSLCLGTSDYGGM